MTITTTTMQVVTCDDCEQEHEASYSHEGRFGEGAVYAVVCGQYIEHYLAERLHAPKGR